jgi:alpha-L-rhamnosidase
MARVLDRTDEAERLELRAAQIRHAFRDAFVREDGRIAGDTQGGYGLALGFDLVPEALRGRTVCCLVRAIERCGGRLSTGIITTPLVLQALADAGHVDLAYRAILGREPPSFGYMVDQGATTIWERWDGFVKGRGFQDPHMNSFNHPSFGAVGEWVYRNVLGLNPDPARPGWKHFVVRPRCGGGLAWARGVYHSMHGRIRVNWRLADARFDLTVSVPTNTTATVILPSADPGAVRWNGRRRDGDSDTETTTRFEVGPGSHRFRCPWSSGGESGR